MPESLLSQSELEALQELDTCMVSNAIETFKVRLRNTGFANSSVRCFFEDFPPMVGYAATARVRSEDPPIDKKTVHDRSEWWKSILEVPAPRIVVLEDMDEPPGRGAFIGDVHAAILQALGCTGVITNGAVRELPRIQETGFHLFAGNVAVSHSYAHIFHLGSTVKIGGLEVRPGDLLHGDRHGVLNIPLQIASQVPSVARGLREKENKLIALCRAGRIPLDKLREMIRVLE
jgi:regulator of RNase E activity RraA